MITVREFGKLQDGRKAMLYTITNKNGNSVVITNYGGCITTLNIADRRGHNYDVVLGYDSLQEYVLDKSHFGAIIGRYANRLAKGQYTIGGKTHSVAINDHDNSLHGGGGEYAFDKVLWDAFISGQDGQEVLTLRHTTHAGENGYNGTVQVTVEYSFNNDDALIMDIYATTDEETILNVCNHSYFNLDGDGQRLYNHKVRIFASTMTQVDDELIPTGDIVALSGALDLRKARQLKTLKFRHPLIKSVGGYDFNYCLNKDSEVNGLCRAAIVKSVESGLKMTVYTSKPGLQFYTGNFLNGAKGKNKKPYNKHTGFCMETQFYPDAPNHDNFGYDTLKVGEAYQHRTIYKFDNK